ncbi:hypothetical protein BCR33DRAFT_856767 [Rhizoclosmatium globosum]|uniref:Uncharacterized protein n=1 Tax=Rhizoclosmatium globosum TaxID=329046 RepID=A0A1Y2BAM6_9FUNG|nr:hypothetical protein BCR33DRAFT_856767 [Rhizoclosmatium globosum]|eukprot:ORY31911.1 hypothetical protein BCR33DRAFT_856767 [Rhizoclosmatium globosum]
MQLTQFTLIGFVSTPILSPIFGRIPLHFVSKENVGLRGYYLRGMSFTTFLYAAGFLVWGTCSGRCNDINTSYSFLKDHPDMTRNGIAATCNVYLWPIVLGSLFLLGDILVFKESLDLVSKYTLSGVNQGLPMMAPVKYDGASSSEMRPFMQPKE